MDASVANAVNPSTYRTAAAHVALIVSVCTVAQGPVYPSTQCAAVHLTMVPVGLSRVGMIRGCATWTRIASSPGRRPLRTGWWTDCATRELDEEEVAGAAAMKSRSRVMGSLEVVGVMFGALQNLRSRGLRRARDGRRLRKGPVHRRSARMKTIAANVSHSAHTPPHALGLWPSQPVRRLEAAGGKRVASPACTAASASSPSQCTRLESDSVAQTPRAERVGKGAAP